MLVVLFAVSVLTFLIFNVIPNGDPAVRMAGRQPTQTQIEAIRKEWGFDRNIVVQYATTMKKVFTGDLKSYFTQLPVDEEIWKGLPRTLSLAVGAAILWMVVAVCFGLYSAVKAGKAGHVLTENDWLMSIRSRVGTPARRVYVDKKHSTKKRPLGLPTWSDKLLQEVIRSLLEAYYEPQFSAHSHGFRPGRGCHDALREVDRHLKAGYFWVAARVNIVAARVMQSSALLERRPR